MLIAPLVGAAIGGFASGAAGGLFGGGGGQVIQQPAPGTYVEPSPFSIAPAAYAAQMGALQSQLTTAAQGTALAQGGQWGAIGLQAQALAQGQLAELQRQVASSQAARGLEVGIAGQYAKAVTDLEKGTGAAKLALTLTPTQVQAELAEKYGTAVGEMGKIGTQQLGELAKTATAGGAEILQQATQGAAASLQEGLRAAGTVRQAGVTGEAGTYQAALQSAGQQLNAAALADLYKPAATAVAQMGQETVAGQNRLVQDVAQTNLRIAEAQEASRNRIAEQRAQIEGQLAIKRFGRSAALAGKASIA